jgi:hypothetical protein
MRPRNLLPVLLAAVAAEALPAPPAMSEIRQLEIGGFAVEHRIVVPGDPNATFDAITGDISGWWDHSFSKPPRRLYIEPRPGGGFYEVFDDAGNGVQHATVIYAHRGRMLRFRGPLGFSGSALDLVVTWSFEAKGDSTQVTSVCNAVGQVEPGWAEATDKVWRHFIVERFKPWVESGGPRERGK